MRLLLALILLLPLSGLGQVVNIESDRGGDKQGLHGSSEFGLSIQSGNVKVLQTTAKLRLDYIRNIHHYLFIGSISYGEENGEEFRNEMYTHLRWTAMWWNNLGVELFVQTQRDDFRLLQLRQLTGAGFRATFFDDVVAIGSGAMSDFEKIQSIENENSDFRSSSYIRLGREWKDRVKGQLIVYYQPLFLDVSDYRILSVGSVEFKIDKVFSMINEFNYSYDTNPPEGVIKDDLLVQVKFRIKW